MLNSLDLMVNNLMQNQGLKIAVAAAEDPTTLYALKWLVMKDLADPILVGSKARILSAAAEIDFDVRELEIVDVECKIQATEISVNLVRDGKAHVLARGAISASEFLTTISNDKSGLKKSNYFSIMTFLYMPNYHKVFSVLSPGTNGNIGLSKLFDLVCQTSSFFHNLGVSTPKIAFISDDDTVNTSVVSMADVCEIVRMNQCGKIPGCIIDGLMDIEMAFCSKNFWGIQNNTSTVEGDVDAIYLPDIQSANIFYKMSMMFNGAKGGGVITGMTSPVAFSSYEDTVETKFYSMALALSQCQK